MGIFSIEFEQKLHLVKRTGFALIVAYPLMFVWQGLDFTDMGYSLTAYQQFLSAPQGITNWGTCAIGWLVSKASGNLGVVAFKLALVLVDWLTLWVVYRLIREHVPPESQFLLPPVLFVTLAYITKSGYEWINYNSLTALFFVMTSFCLYRGLTGASLPWIGLSGFFAGFNMFVRMPSLLGLGLVLLIPAWGWVTRNQFRNTLTPGLAFLIGALIGLAGTLLLIFWIGHGENYLADFRGIWGMATNAESHHSSGLLLHLFVRDHVRALVGGNLALFSVYLTAKILHRAKVVVIVIVALASAIVALPGIPYGHAWRWLVTGTAYLGLLAGTWYGFRHDARLMLLSLLAGCVLVLAPLGSDNGMYNAVYGSWLALPVLFVLVVRLIQSDRARLACRKMSVNVADVRLTAIIMASMLLAFSVTQKVFNTFRDHPNRLLMTYAVDEPLLNGVFTTEPRARVVKELLTELNQHVRPGDEVLAYDSMPMVHYLTKTIPYLGTSWPMLSMPDKIRSRLQEKGRQSLPVVIVREPGKTLNPLWPLGSRLLFNREHDAGNRRVFHDFEIQHGYAVIWSNGFFEILAQRRAEAASTNDRWPAQLRMLTSEPGNRVAPAKTGANAT